MSNLVDREKVRRTFAEYVKDYDVNDPKVALKIKHTYKVSELCEIIAKSENLTEKDQDIAWLCGMLHDIGRFEQVRIYNTFSDADSVDHAKFGVELLFGEKNLIKNYVEDESIYGLIHDSINYHNVYRIPEDLDERTSTFTKILRDADKIDIIRANNETPLEDIYNTTKEEVENSFITDEVLKGFYEHHAILRSLKKTAIDNLVGHISLMYELEYRKSRELAANLGYLDAMMDFKSKNPDTAKKLEEIKIEIHKYLADNQ